jgi:hypothetical protein
MTFQCYTIHLQKFIILTSKVEELYAYIFCLLLSKIKFLLTL